MWWRDLLQHEFSDPSFLLDPYIPREGIVLLHGRKSQGKSGLSWGISLAIASGQAWLGHSVPQPSRVLYLEVDGPPLLVVPRMQKLGADYPVDLPLYVANLAPGFDILHPTEVLVRKLRELREISEPEFVVVNTLRKVFSASANDSEVPSRVYAAFKHHFPKAAFLFIHHDRKRFEDRSADEVREDVSGSLAWLNDAQVTLHLTKHGKTPGMVRLDHTGSQVSELAAPLVLRVAEDGSHVTLAHEAALDEVAALMNAYPELSGRELDAALAASMGCSERSAQRRRLEFQKLQAEKRTK